MNRSEQVLITAPLSRQIIAQATWAAVCSIRRDAQVDTKSVAGSNLKVLHSLHAYFLAFGNAEIPVLYAVSVSSNVPADLPDLIDHALTLFRLRSD